MSSKQKDDKIFTLLLGLLVLVYGLASTIDHVRLWANYSIAWGTVIGVYDRHVDKKTFRSPVVKFTTAKGEEITFRSDAEGYNTNDRVKVKYFPDAPERATLDSFFVMFVFDLFALLMGAGMIADGVRYFRT